MKEPVLLLAVKRIVSRVDVEDDPLSRLGVRIQKGVDKAICKPEEDSRTLLDLSKQKTTGVGSGPSSTEISHHLARTKAFKLKLLGNTLCMQDSGSFLGCNCRDNSILHQVWSHFFAYP